MITKHIMMRQIVPYLIAAIAFTAFASVGYASGVAEDAELLKLIAENEDAHITPIDLAFFLATHNYDATPEDGYVIIKICGTAYKAMPNGIKAGLADLTIIS